MGKHAGRPATIEHELAGFKVVYAYFHNGLLEWVPKGRHRA